MEPADNTSGADLGQAASPEVGSAPGGVMREDSAGGIHRIKSTTLRRAAVVAFWLLAPAVLLFMWIIAVAGAILTGCEAALGEGGNAYGRMFREIATAFEVSVEGTGIAWRRR